MFGLFGYKKKSFTDELCLYMKTDYGQLLDFLMKGEKNYTIRYIKRSHKRRKTFEPNEKLAKMQRFAVERVFSEYPVSKYSTAYQKGCSIQKNAAAHKKAKFAARYDIADFFGTCRYALFNKLLRNKYDREEVNLLWLIVSLNDGLPVGAYSSPFVSNRLMYDFDNAVAKSFKRLTFTRYADDMFFSSTKPLPPTLEGELILELARSGFELNPKKTRKYGEKTPKKITGVFVTEKKLTVGKRYKLRVKKLLYKFKTTKKGNKSKIWGMLGHIKNTEPDYYLYLVNKYNIKIKQTA